MSYRNIPKIGLDNLPSITNETRDILIEHGITDVYTLYNTPDTKLINIGIDTLFAKNLLQEAYEIMSKYISTFELDEGLRKRIAKKDEMTTGCRDLDDLFGGGLVTTQLYEFYGPNRVGKTKLLHQFICTAALPKKFGGLDSSSIYIDAEGSFAPERLKIMTPRFGLDFEQILKGVIRFPIHTVNELIECVEEKLSPILENSNVRVILLDSIITNARDEFTGIRNLPIRQGVLGKIASTLKKTAESFNAVVIVTNQIVTEFSNGSIAHAGGNVLGHESQFRVAINYVPEKPEIREFFAEKGIDLPEEKCYLRIYRNGFQDIKGGI